MAAGDDGNRASARDDALAVGSGLLMADGNEAPPDDDATGGGPTGSAAFGAPLLHPSAPPATAHAAAADLKVIPSDD